jgi:enoyl-CoA hydratase
LAAIFDAEWTPSSQRMQQLDYYASFLKLRDLPFPTIAAVQGPAIGAGLNLALVCDVVIAGPAARFGATFAKLGLHPGGGCTSLLTNRMGAGRALRTLLLGRVLDGQEAYETGVADVLASDPLEAAIDTADQIAALNPSLARDMKQTVRLASHGSFEAALGFESYAQAASAFEPGVREGIRTAGRSTHR